jgi:hypothetical protein
MKTHGEEDANELHINVAFELMADLFCQFGSLRTSALLQKVA